MKTILRSVLFLVILCFTSTASFSQQKNFDFEKITAADFNTIHTKDSSAVAEVIADVGRTWFDYGPDGFYLIFNRKTRIHILKPEGTSNASIEIPLYKGASAEEIVMSFKGYTYNLEQGEVVKTKVRNEDMFKQEENEHWNTQKIAMPAARANSIIEFEYQIHSDFTFNLQPWAFQADIPVNWSEYTVKIPEYFNYKIISQGYLPFTIKNKSGSQQKFSVYHEPEIIPGLNKERKAAHTETYEILADEYRWVAVNVPAMKPEPFITTINDYITKIEFELASVKFPGSLTKVVINSWESLNDELLEDDDFGAVIKRGGFISEMLPLITKNVDSDVEKVKAIFDHVKYRMKWDGTSGVFARNLPKKVYAERIGSAADINLMLVAVLKEAGFNCEPVILSTRSHGRTQEVYPMLAKFNYVVALVRIDSMSYLLDATSRYQCFNTLPERCLNYDGRVISKDHPGWIQLLNTETKNTSTRVDINLSNDGSLKGNCTITSAGLTGNERRNAFTDKTEKEFVDEFIDKLQNCSVSKFQISNLDTLDKAFKESYDFEIIDEAQITGDHMYLNIMSRFCQKTNPFKLEKRVYPVDFSCPIMENYSLSIAIPKGWVVEQLPDPATMFLPDKTGSFRYITQENEGIIRIVSLFKLNKNMFMPEEYDLLKEFFRLMIAKQAEQIVLKKV